MGCIVGKTNVTAAVNHYQSRTSVDAISQSVDGALGGLVIQSLVLAVTAGGQCCRQVGGGTGQLNTNNR